jgi:hypothetical protein
MATILETFIYREEIKSNIRYTSTADHSSDLRLRNPILEKPSFVLIAFLE